MKEPALEKLLRRFRLRRILSYVDQRDVILDVGCGWQAKALRELSPHISRGIGIDFKVEKSNVPDNLDLYSQRFEEPWPLAAESCDKAIMLAVLEHVEGDLVPTVLANIRSALKDKGQLLLTVPTPRSQPVLEFLAYRLGVINEAEIRDHKIYYDRSRLEDVLRSSGFEVLKYNTFQLGMNSFCSARKI